MNNRNNKMELLGNAPIPKALMAMGIPTMLGMMVNAIYNLVDAYFVGSLGTSQMGAISVVYPLGQVVVGLGLLFGNGSASYLSRLLGKGDKEKANQVASTALYSSITVGAIMIILSIIFLRPILKFLGATDSIMPYAITYASIYIISCIFNVFNVTMNNIVTSEGAAKTTMCALMTGAILNIGLDPVFIYILNMGVAGAAISTLVSRIFCAVVVLWQLRKDRQPVVVKDYLKIRPDWSMIGRILGLGIPSGIENSMFQLGKLAIQSTVSTLGTAAIAAQAMTNILENLNGIAAIGVGVGLMTIVGQCLGAGRKDEAVYYIKKLCVIAEAVIIVSCLIVYILVRPVTILGGMESTSAEMCIHMITWITIVKPVVWTMAFVPGYGLRAAGDVKFSMITSCCTMWACRFCLCVFLIRVLGFGPMGVWIGMFADWTVRGIIFTWRFHSRKWLEHKVI